MTKTTVLVGVVSIIAVSIVVNCNYYVDKLRRIDLDKRYEECITGQSTYVGRLDKFLEQTKLPYRCNINAGLANVAVDIDNSSGAVVSVAIVKCPYHGRHKVNEAAMLTENSIFSITSPEGSGWGSLELCNRLLETEVKIVYKSSRI